MNGLKSAREMCNYGRVTSWWRWDFWRGPISKPHHRWSRKWEVLSIGRRAEADGAAQRTPSCDGSARHHGCRGVWAKNAAQ